MRGPIRKVYADVKVCELLGTPNVKTRAISNEALLFEENVQRLSFME